MQQSPSVPLPYPLLPWQHWGGSPTDHPLPMHGYHGWWSLLESILCPSAAVYSTQNKKARVSCNAISTSDPYSGSLHTEPHAFHTNPHWSAKPHQMYTIIIYRKYKARLGSYWTQARHIHLVHKGGNFMLVQLAYLSRMLLWVTSESSCTLRNT